MDRQGLKIEIACENDLSIGNIVRLCESYGLDLDSTPIAYNANKCTPLVLTCAYVIDGVVEVY